MKINVFKDVDIVKRKNGTFEIFFNENGIRKSAEISDVLYNSMKKCKNSANDDSLIQSIINNLRDVYDVTVELSGELSKSDKKELAQMLIDFFIEFDYDVSTRFINTVARFNTTEEINEYVKNYFKLSGNRNYARVQNKLKSTEWGIISKKLRALKAPDEINTRLEVYFGPQGTGKTTVAIKNSDNVMVCHSGMLPQDMLEDFKFDDGKPSFDKSVFYTALEDGKTIVLDEFNLLPFETIRFLQSIFDGKKELIYKNRVIKIHDDFKAIATMNLFVNGIEFSLPEPIVDRCEVIKEFKPNASLLANVI